VRLAPFSEKLSFTFPFWDGDSVGAAVSASVWFCGLFDSVFVEGEIGNLLLTRGGVCFLASHPSAKNAKGWGTLYICDLILHRQGWATRL
jgi:hypothetical protein